MTSIIKCMEWKTVSYDWNQIRAFLATAEEGSFSAAARALDLTQPTLGRQIAALEDQLGVTLFSRQGRRLEPTAAGLELLEHAQSMLEAANLLSLTATGKAQAIEGEVSISANEMMTAYVLPGFVEKLRQTAPRIEVRLIASDSVSDLTKREADIAIRHVRPEQPDLIARRIGHTKAHIYASSIYLDRVGRPGGDGDPTGAQLITDENRNRLKHAMTERGLICDETGFRIMSSSRIAIWEMVKLSIGAAVMTDDIAAREPGVETLCADRLSFSIPVWMAAHKELRTSRRIRTVFDLLADHLKESGRYRD